MQETLQVELIAIGLMYGFHLISVIDDWWLEVDNHQRQRSTVRIPSESRLRQVKFLT